MVSVPALQARDRLKRDSASLANEVRISQPVQVHSASLANEDRIIFMSGPVAAR